MIGLEMRSMASAIVKPRTMQQPAFEVSNSQWPICTQNRPFLVEDATGRFWPNPDPWLPTVGSLCNTIGMMQGQLPIFTRVPDSQYVDVAFLKFVAHLVVTH